MLTFILGGARSGKSRYALNLARELTRDNPSPEMVFIATATACDAEMTDRIQRHRSDRESIWITVEEPMNPAAVVRANSNADVIVVDCITLFLTNHFMELWSDETEHIHELSLEGIRQVVGELIDAAVESPSQVIMVANELGLGLVPETPLGRVFRDAAGWANQEIAANADHVLLMVAGIPLTVKGQAAQ
jgi:adenosylcobinamide kinase/adenosylcobinamide-phosphate guanylyltransferase